MVFVFGGVLMVFGMFLLNQLLFILIEPVTFYFLLFKFYFLPYFGGYFFPGVFSGTGNKVFRTAFARYTRF